MPEKEQQAVHHTASFEETPRNKTNWVVLSSKKNFIHIMLTIITDYVIDLYHNNDYFDIAKYWIKYLEKNEDIEYTDSELSSTF